jgi:hypothetical protein
VGALWLDGARRTLLLGHQLCQPALLSSRRIFVNNALLASPVEELHRVSVSCGSLGARRAADLFQGGAKLASMSAVLFCASTGLAHTLCCGPDTGHGYLEWQMIRSGACPELRPKS